MRKQTAALAAGIASLALAGGVLAQLSSSSSSLPQKVGTGTLAVSFVNTGNTVWTDEVSNLAAGDSVQRFVDIKNSGTLKVVGLSMSQTNTLGDLLTAPSDILVRYEACSVAWNTTDGTCSGVISSSLDQTSVAGWNGDLGMAGFSSFEANDVRHLKVTTTLAATATSDVQGKSGTITYTVRATPRPSMTYYVGEGAGPSPSTAAK